MCQCRFMDCIKCTILVGNVSSRLDVEGGGREYMGTLSTFLSILQRIKNCSKKTIVCVCVCFYGVIGQKVQTSSYKS